MADSAAAQGELTFDTCLANDQSRGCLDLDGSPLSGASGVALSPDAQSVYVVSAASNAISHFGRGIGGQLSYRGCVADPQPDPCLDLPGAPLAGALAVAVSPDGKSVYVASATSNSLSHFFRGPQGELTYDGCLNNNGSSGCINLPGLPITAPSAVAVSPDGGSVYLASSGSGSIAHFFRNGPEGQLTYDGCLANDASQGCVDLTGSPLGGASGVAVSANGKSVYVVSQDSNSLSHFSRFAEGQLDYEGCLANDASQGCGDLMGSPLRAPTAVAVSPDAASVYVSSAAGSSLAHFLPDGSEGELTYGGCLADEAADGCGALPGAPIESARAVAVSPDNRSVYVAAYSSASISHFVRALPSPPTQGPLQPPPPQAPLGPAPDATPPNTAISKGPRKATKARAARFRFSADEPGSSFQCRLDRQKKWEMCSSPYIVKGLRRGRHRLMVRATDRAGNTDPTPAKWAWKVARGR